GPSAAPTWWSAACQAAIEWSRKRFSPSLHASTKTAPSRRSASIASALRGAQRRHCRKHLVADARDLLGHGLRRREVVHQKVLEAGGRVPGELLGELAGAALEEDLGRSEERRVGKEWRYRGARYH